MENDLTCLDNIVGVKCTPGATDSLSGFYIDSLPFMSVAKASNMADKEYLSGVKLLKDKIDFATKLVVADLQVKMMPYFRMNKTIDELLVGYFKNTYLTQSAAQRGAKIRVKNSRFLKLRVSAVRVRILEANYSGQLKIIDGGKTYVYNYTTDANGEVTVYVNFTAETREIYVVMEDANITPVDTYVRKNCNCYNNASEFLIAHGSNAGANAMNAYGLEVQVTAECDNNALTCIIAHHLGLPILYKSAIEILKEYKGSSRLNSITLLIDKDKIDEELANNYKSYNKYFSTLVKQLPELFKRVDDICVVCNQSRFVTMTP